MLVVALGHSSAHRRWSTLDGSPTCWSSFRASTVLRGISVRYATTLTFTVVVGLIYYLVPNTRSAVS